MDEHDLLAAYARTGSEAAFAELVSRYVPLVYSAARRFTGNPQHAEEITQAVFIVLARKAGRLGRTVVISGWLYETARLTSANFVKREIRRQNREQEAYMQSLVNEPEANSWRDIAPLLDEAMGSLGAADRDAVVLRFFENRTAPEVARQLKVNEAAAHKRVSRALEKLRRFFTKRGVVLSAAALAGAVSANSVQAAPAGLAQMVSGVALAKGAAAGGSTLMLVKGALNVMAWTQAKTVLITGFVVLLAAGTTTVTVREIHEHQDEAWQLGQLNSTFLQKPPYRAVILPTRSAQRSPAMGTGGMVTFADGPVMAINASIADMLRVAYVSEHGVISANRTLFAAAVPTNKYDFFFNKPGSARRDLQTALRRKFGLTGRSETMETNVWGLRVKYRSAGLRPGYNPAGPGGGSTSTGDGEISAKNTSLDELARQLEGMCPVPVVNQTGLTNYYDYKIHWNEWGKRDETGAYPAYPDHPDVEGLKKALVEQTGLELVPGAAPVEFLVIEKAN